jgi:hypothetical protein
LPRCDCCDGDYQNHYYSEYFLLQTNSSSICFSYLCYIETNS